MVQKTSTITFSTIATFGLLKLPTYKIDPYTRFVVGGIAGAGLFAYGTIYRNPILQWLGIGVVIGSALTLEEVVRIKGGKIIENDFTEPIFILHEDLGVIQLQPKEIPNYRTDGLTIKGMNKVFKVRDGVYLKILADGTITETLGAGKFFNKITMAGFKSKEWVKKESDRWKALYEKSL